MNDTMTTDTTTKSPEAASVPPPGAASAPKRAARGRRRLLTRRDRFTLALMAGVPTVLHVALVWVTALASIALAFTTWDGIGFDSIRWVGLQNFEQLFNDNPQFWPAVQHNIIWFVVLILIPTPLGLFLAVQLDKRIRFSRVYQTAFFLPVVISMACIGFVWQLVYNPDTGLINSLIGANTPGHYIDWIGDPDLNLWAVLVAASWRHTGYMMILYLVGLKGVDPSSGRPPRWTAPTSGRRSRTSSSPRCAPPTRSCWSSPSSRPCAPSTWSSSSTRVPRGPSCSRSW